MKLPISDAAHLRPLRRSDANQLHALIEANRPRLRPWLAWAAGRVLDSVVYSMLASEWGVAGDPRLA